MKKLPLRKRELNTLATILDQLLFDKYSSEKDPPHSFDEKEYHDMKEILNTVIDLGGEVQ